MSDKQQDASGAFFALPGMSVVSLEGRDASTFAQAQFMSDVVALQPGHWHWSGWLTPKGRLIALFALLRHDEQTLKLLLPDAAPDDIVAQLQRFVFRSKVTIRSHGDLPVSGRFSAPDAAAASRIGTLDGDALELDFGSLSTPRTLHIGVAAPADDVAAREWACIDIAHGLPRLAPARPPEWTPQQLSLERLKAFSVKKGCYPGQEIVARTHFLGQVKRGLVRLHGNGLADASDVSTPENDRVIGQLVCLTGDDALAVLPLDAGDGPFSVAGQPVERLPLLDGLAR